MRHGAFRAVDAHLRVGGQRLAKAGVVPGNDGRPLRLPVQRRGNGGLRRGGKAQCWGAAAVDGVAHAAVNERLHGGAAPLEENATAV